MSEERPKAVVLRPAGECPQWGTSPGSETPMDPEIRAAREAPFDKQRDLFFGLVRALYDQQVRVAEEQRFDPVDNDQWIEDLATWLRWSDDVRDAEKARAVKSAYEVLDYEIEDAAGGAE